MNKKGLLILFIIFLFVFILNNFTPLLNEDYFCAFVWPKGVPNLGILPEDAKRISGLSDVLENCRTYYLMEGGRVPGGLLLGVLFWNLEKAYFNPFNALVMIVLVIEIYWLSCKGRVTFNFNPSYLFWIFFCLWAFNLSFIDTCLWMSGSSNYLWMLIVVLAFLLPFIQNYYDNNLHNKDSCKMTAGMFFIGILAGWSHETTIIFLIILLCYWLHICKKKGELQNWKISAFLGLCLGYILLIFAPGNFNRLSQQANLNGGIPIIDLYSYKFFELMWIITFHFFLLFFIINFLFKNNKKFANQSKIKPYLDIAKACTMIAIGSGVIMFLIPVSGWRPSFLSLVFLVIAAVTLFRTQEITGVPIFNRQGKMFLKFIGYSYLVMTVSVSLWYNYTNSQCWNAVIEQIRQEQKNPSNSVLAIEPYYTVDKPLLNFLSGFHIIYMPVAIGDENHRINVTLAKYYGIKGIKLKQ